MDSEPIAFLLEMFGVSVREFIPGHSVFVALDYLSDKEAYALAKQDGSVARFVTAALSGKVDGTARRRPGLYRRSRSLPTASGKQGHPNNLNVRKQAEALKERFGINIRQYDGSISACDYIAAAEAERWPQEIARDIENIALKNLDLSMSELRTLALQKRARTIDSLISRA